MYKSNLFTLCEYISFKNVILHYKVYVGLGNNKRNGIGFVLCFGFVFLQ